MSSQHPRLVAGWAALSAIVCLIALAPCARAQGQSANTSPASPQPTLSAVDVTLDPPEGVTSFRFLPGGTWSDFDRPLLLCAAQGEDRSYQIEFGARAPSASQEGGTSAEATIVAVGPPRGFRIDKRPPSAPLANPGTGLYRKPLSPALLSEPGSSVYWALVGPQSTGAFQRLDAGGGPSMELPKLGSVTYTLIAYAVDAAGNRSRLARYVYLLASEGLPATMPQTPAAQLSALADDSLPQPRVLGEEGAVELLAAAVQGTSFLVDVNPDAPPKSLDDFVQVEGTRFRIPCPYGWKGEITIYYGTRRNDELRFNPLPLQATLAWEPEAMAPPPTPGAPRLVADAMGRGAFLSFPGYDGTIYVSIDGAPAQQYQGPLPVESTSGQLKVAWFGTDARGRRSDAASVVLALPSRAPDLAIVGVTDGARVGGDLALGQSGPGILRYELGSADSPPPEPSASSPILSAPLTISCPAGARRQILIRYRSYLDATPAAPAGDEKILSFTIDKMPPPVPSLLESSQPYSDRPVSLAFATEGDGVSIYSSVTEGGAASSFAAVSGPIELPGAESGPVSYLVRAYAVDELGNRSAEMRPVTIVVDRDSLYAAQDAPDGGDGSPAHPFASLETALRAAAAAGKKNIYLRGGFNLNSPFRTSRDLALIGGFAEDWSPDPAQRATIAVEPPAGAALLEADGSRLAMRGLVLQAAKTGGALAAAKAGGALEIVDSALEVHGTGDSVILQLQSASLHLSDSTLSAAAAMSCTAVDARDAAVTLSDSVISAGSSVHAFNACVIDGGSLRVERSLFRSSADLALRLFDVRNAQLSIERSLVQVQGGSGYLRIGSFSDAPGEIRDSKFDVAWRGEGTLFELEGRAPAFRYDTIFARTSSGALRGFEAKGTALQIWNSIVSCASGGRELLRTDGALEAGSLVADCIWGFPTLVAGAMDVRSLDALNALNAPSALYSSRRHLSEPPESTFDAPEKGIVTLSPRSACVGAALPLEASGGDFLDHARPGPGAATLPDIGADEISE